MCQRKARLTPREKSVQEGLFLYTHNLSPYDGGVFYQASLEPEFERQSFTKTTPGTPSTASIRPGTFYALLPCYQHSLCDPRRFVRRLPHHSS